MITEILFKFAKFNCSNRPKKLSLLMAKDLSINSYNKILQVSCMRELAWFEINSAVTLRFVNNFYFPLISYVISYSSFIKNHTCVVITICKTIFNYLYHPARCLYKIAM